jgi:hypothetical protein
VGPPFVGGAGAGGADTFCLGPAAAPSSLMSMLGVTVPPGGVLRQEDPATPVALPAYTFLHTAAAASGQAPLGVGGGLPVTPRPAGAPPAPPAPCQGRDFLAQLGAIATDSTRGYKYRMSDSGYGQHSFLRRAPTASLPGTLTGAGD